MWIMKRLVVWAVVLWVLYALDQEMRGTLPLASGALGYMFMTRAGQWPIGADEGEGTAYFRTFVAIFPGIAIFAAASYLGPTLHRVAVVVGIGGGVFLVLAGLAMWFKEIAQGVQQLIARSRGA